MPQAQQQRVCKSSNIPQVDNTALECTEFINTQCILHPDVLTYLNLPVNSNMRVVINTLLTSLIDARNRVIALETRATALETRVTTLENA